jgi:hypothetical protein
MLSQGLGLFDADTVLISDFLVLVVLEISFAEPLLMCWGVATNNN